LPENATSRELAQAIRERGTRYLKGGPECLEGTASKERFAYDQEAPGVGDNIESAFD
jgi:hypothetical protein